VPVFGLNNQALARLSQLNGFDGDAIVHVNRHLATEGDQGLPSVSMPMASAGLAICTINPIGAHHGEWQRIFQNSQSPTRVAKRREIEGGEVVCHGALVFAK